MSSDEAALRSSQANEAEEASEAVLEYVDVSTAKVLDDFLVAAGDGSAFRSPSGEMSQAASLCLKALFDFSCSTAPAWGMPSGLSELHVEGFDTEQIWGQLEASCGPALKQLRKKLKLLSPDFVLLDEETEAALDELLLKANGIDGPSGSESSDESEFGLDDSAPPTSPAEQINPKAQKRKRSSKQEDLDDRPLLPTEDKFLRLDDMERFVQDAEEAAMRDNASNDEEDAGDEDDDARDDSDLEGLNPDALGAPSDQEKEDAEEESNSDEEDAELARLLESASGMVGKKVQTAKGRKRQRKADSEDEEADEEEAYFYSDFFGPGGPRLEDALAQEGLSKTAMEDGTEDDLSEEDEDAAELEAEQLDGEEDEEEEDEEGVGEEDDLRQAGAGSEGAREALLGSLQTLLDKKRAEEAGLGDKQDVEGLSAHERRVLRMAERARKLEEENMGEKQWFMRGEAKAGARPLNSALEIDMDFDRSLKPPPQPTEEFTSSLEDLIKRRIADQQFDDPIRREPPPDLVQKQAAELDDKQSAKGLGEVYEEEFVRARAGNVVEDKDEKTRTEARLILRGLFAKLDALSHFHFAPKPIIKDMTVQREVPALAMEEVALQVVSEAARQMPEEVYKAPGKAEAGKEELQGRSERKRRRAASKRQYKKREGQDGVPKKQAEEGGNIIGRKSAQKDAADVAASKKDRMKAKRKRSKQEDAPAIKYNKSSAVFGKIQDAKSLKPSKNTSASTTSNSLKL